MPDGRQSTSTEGLSQWLEDWLATGRRVVMTIGGPDGLAPQVLERADQRWSLSPLTLPHELARLVVAEQVYRALTIVRNVPYHK